MTPKKTVCMRLDQINQNWLERTSRLTATDRARADFDFIRRLLAIVDSDLGDKLTAKEAVQSIGGDEIWGDKALKQRKKVS